MREHGAAALAFTLRVLCMTILITKTHRQASLTSITIVLFSTVRLVADLWVRTPSLLHHAALISAGFDWSIKLVSVDQLSFTSLGSASWVRALANQCVLCFTTASGSRCRRTAPHRSECLGNSKFIGEISGRRSPRQGGRDMFNSLLCGAAECCCNATLF